METKYGFTKMNAREFRSWMKNLRVARTVLTVQQHHTYIPDHSTFRNNPDHFSIQQGMKNHHVNNNGWSHIAQHFTIFPDGAILTGRSLEKSPAGIYGNNANSICIENLGNFDLRKDTVTPEQRDSIVEVTAALCDRFNIPANTDKILYHHWFNLVNGNRNNGRRNNKSCPGTSFFGGNKVADCTAGFIPKIKDHLQGSPAAAPPEVLKYSVVTARSLNVRKGAGSGFSKAGDRAPVSLGAVLRVYKEKNGWYKISNSKNHWVSGRYTKDIYRAVVEVKTRLNIRSGPGTSYNVVGSLQNGEEIFIEKTEGNWCKLVMQEKWVGKKYLKM